MEKKFMDKMPDLQDAMQDKEWLEKLRQVKTRDEFAGLCREKGIVFAGDETGSAADLLPGTTDKLSDDELDRATGGFIRIGVSIDLCQKQYSCFCTRMPWGYCDNFKVGEQINGFYNVGCIKGYFTGIKTSEP